MIKLCSCNSFVKSIRRLVFKKKTDYNFDNNPKDNYCIVLYSKLGAVDLKKRFFLNILCEV
ncbi:hypothetical protein GCM10007384_08630 [Aquimarina muelleri]|uniref:Uncharacterized protein n=1 Tax=Aquimarina muelleri TaxID=279356 RepID=A0A918JU37_9FLAO|nr:hypothetical protein GCM10007384_08630 [Aquimarina muelleri]